MDRPFNDLNEELNKLVGKYMAKGLELEFILAIMRAHADLLERINAEDYIALGESNRKNSQAHG